MKKILFPILATVLIAFAIMPLAAETVFANTVVDEQGVEYTLDDENHTAVVSGHKDALRDSVDIPGSVSGCTVTSIESRAFLECENLTSITLPESVTSIRAAAFMSCESLTSITIPAGVTSIESQAFLGCSSLTSITIPAGVTSIEEFAFTGTGLKTIIFENGSLLDSIRDEAFSYCNSLTNITIPAGVTRIETFAFRESGLALVHYIGDETAWEGVSKGNNWAPSNTAVHCVPNKTTRKATPDADGGIDRYLCDEEGCGDWGYGGTVIRRPVISLSETSFDYDGTVKKPEVSVKDTAGETVETSNYDVTIKNSAGTAVTDPKDEGIYYVNVTMQGEKYEGTKVLAYTIGDPISIQDAEVVLSATEYTYNGTVQKPDIVTIGGMDLTEGTDFTAVWSNESSTNAGTYTVTITGKDFYTGTTSASYTIDTKVVTVKAENASKTYGEADPPAFTATASGLLGTDTLTYTVARETGENTGTYAIKPTGEAAQGNYTVTYENGTFTIDPKAVTPTVKVGNKVYTGKALKPVVTVKVGTVTFKNGTDYTVGYSNNTKVGKATTKVTMKGNYKGSKTATFKILPKKAGISKAVPGKKLVKVTMSTKVSATGGTVYQIQYRIKGAAKWKTTTTKNKTKTIKKLKKGKQYQIRVRAYKSVSGSKYYGAWSKVKTTKKVK